MLPRRRWWEQRDAAASRTEPSIPEQDGRFIIHTFTMKKYLLLLIPIALIVVLFIVAPSGTVTVPVDSSNTNSAAVNENANTSLPQAFAIFTYQGQEGKTAFALLDELYEVEYQQFDFGPLVKSIEGEASSDSRFWLYYVNGEQAQIGADQYVTKDGDTILWRLEESTE